MTTQGHTPETQQASGIGRSLIADLAAHAEIDRPFARAYVVTLRGSEAERVHWDDDPPEKLFLRAPVRVWGQTFVRFGDDSLVNPAEVAEIRLVTSEEAAEIESETEDEADAEDTRGEHVFDAIEDLKQALAAVTVDRRPAIFPPAPASAMVAVPVVGSVPTLVGSVPTSPQPASASPLPPPPEVRL